MRIRNISMKSGHGYGPQSITEIILLFAVAMTPIIMAIYGVLSSGICLYKTFVSGTKISWFDITGLICGFLILGLVVWLRMRTANL